jgi:hypothetical protein
MLYLSKNYSYQKSIFSNRAFMDVIHGRVYLDENTISRDYWEDEDNIKRFFSNTRRNNGNFNRVLKSNHRSRTGMSFLINAKHLNT